MRRALAVALLAVATTMAWWSDSTEGGGRAEVAPATRSGVALKLFGRFRSPVYLAAAPRDRRRLFVVELDGRVLVVRDGRRLRRPFLDLRNQVSRARVSGGLDHGGLFSIAFPPDYGRTRRFYVFYTHRRGSLQVEEFRRSRSSRNRADPRSGRVVLGSRRPPTSTSAGRSPSVPTGCCTSAWERGRTRPPRRTSPRCAASSSGSPPPGLTLRPTGCQGATHSSVELGSAQRSSPLACGTLGGFPSTGEAERSRSAMWASAMWRRSTSCPSGARRGPTSVGTCSRETSEGELGTCWRTPLLRSSTPTVEGPAPSSVGTSCVAAPRGAYVAATSTPTSALESSGRHESYAVA